MNRPRWLVIILILLALAAIFLFVGRDWRAVLPPGLARVFTARMQPASAFGESSFERLPRWAVSLATLLALFIFGAANLYMFPARVRKMQKALTVSWGRFFQVALAGLAFGLLFVLGALLASLARVTFPLTLMTGLALFILSLWGYLALAYTVGGLLLSSADWFRSPFAALLLGLLILHALIHLPFVGVLISLLGVGAGLGIVITTRFGSLQPWDVNMLLEENKE
jgi:hypothetical protein